MITFVNLTYRENERFFARDRDNENEVPDLSAACNLEDHSIETGGA